MSKSIDFDAIFDDADDVKLEKVNDSNFTFSEKLKEEYFKILNADQRKAFEGIEAFLTNPEQDYAVLLGYAGTGKTFLLSKIIDCLDSCDTAMTAPTNKAVKVMADNGIVGDVGKTVTYQTIHKLLALKLITVFPRPGQTFTPYQKLQADSYNPPTINNYQLLIVDESSMLDDELMLMIHKVKHRNLKVIFVGDPAQIPPVNHMDSIPLTEKGRETYRMPLFTLKKIMRQEDGSAILQTGAQIRSNLQAVDSIDSSNRTTRLDAFFYNAHTQEHKYDYMRKMMALFKSEEFSSNANHCKVIAWTNKVVNEMNRIIRKNLFKEDSEKESILVGEKLIADTAILEAKTVLFNTSDEFEVLEIQKCIHNYTIPKEYIINTKRDKETKDLFEGDKSTFKSLDYKIEYYWLTVNYYSVFSKSFITAKIKVPTSNGEAPLAWALAKLTKLAKLDSNKNLSTNIWKEKYALDEQYAKVKYNYAITAHKAQGSTYHHVFIIEDDIDKNRNIEERNRIKYTACTRPSKSLHILSKRNTNE